jgi:predicted TIM-barrel fold metal-dependent hydrolase
MAKKYVVVDAEFHHVPKQAVDEAQRVVPRFEEGRKIQARLKELTSKAEGRKMSDIEAAIRQMDECGVDMAMVGQASWAPAGLEFCRACNDGLAKLSKEYPGKFIPLAIVPCLEGQVAIDELDRAINDLGLKGVTVLTSQGDMRLDDERMKPFFRKASQLRIPVAVHPSTNRPLWGGVKYHMSGSVSREYEIIKAFVEVLCGVLPEFPDLNFLFSHYGGGVPFLLGRIMSWYAPEDAGLPEDKIGSPKTIKEFEDFGLKKGFNELLDRIHYNMAGTGGWMPPVKQALMVLKPDRLCFGSDYPHEMSRPADLKAYINGIKRLDIPEAHKVKMLGGNVKRLYGV